MLRGRNTAAGNVSLLAWQRCGHGIRRCTIGRNNALTSTFGPSSCVTPDSPAADGPLLHPGDAHIVPKSAEPDRNVAATSRRRTSNVGGAGRNILVNVKGARSGHGTFL